MPESAKERILADIQEDFVEPVVNFYVHNEREKKFAFELWRTIKKVLLKKESQ